MACQAKIRWCLNNNICYIKSWWISLQAIQNQQSKMKFLFWRMGFMFLCILHLPLQFNWGASFWTNDEETFMNLYWALVGETITVWQIGVDHQTLVFFTIELWRLHLNYITLECQTIGIWCIPSDFGVTIGL